MGAGWRARQLHRAGPRRDRFRAGALREPGAARAGRGGDAVAPFGTAGRYRRRGIAFGVAGGRVYHRHDDRRRWRPHGGGARKFVSNRGAAQAKFSTQRRSKIFVARAARNLGNAKGAKDTQWYAMPSQWWQYLRVLCAALASFALSEFLPLRGRPPRCLAVST